MKEKAVEARGVLHVDQTCVVRTGGSPYALLLPSTDRKML